MSDSIAPEIEISSEVPRKIDGSVAAPLGFRRSAMELIVLLAMVWLADLLLYQVGSFAAWGVMLTTITLALLTIRWSSARRVSFGLIAIPLLVLAGKLLWGGSELQIACGMLLVFCLSMAAAGIKPWLPEGFLAVVYMLVGATGRLRQYRFGPNAQSGPRNNAALYAALIPIVVISVFSSLFVMANPDLLTNVQLQVSRIASIVGDYLFGLSMPQFVFWCGSGWLLLGLAFPKSMRTWDETRPVGQTEAGDSILYAAARNSLMSVIGLFAVYLIFEFSTLWFRRLPADFYYAGYAHQGAFWLTVALAVATGMLSIVFRGRILGDRRLPRLKLLAWIWSAENLLLALAVVNRMLIYIHYNGMTRLRIVGLLGIAAVVAGFVWVVIKILRGHNFAWLIHRQLWCPVVALLLYAMLPVDWISNAYNTLQVNRGRAAPAVQIIAHRCGAEGILPLVQLIDAEDPEVRQGVRALLAHWALRLEMASGSSQANPPAGRHAQSSTVWVSELGHSSPWVLADQALAVARPRKAGWLHFQLSETLLKGRLEQTRADWQRYADSALLRQRALNTFFEKTYPWY